VGLLRRVWSDALAQRLFTTVVVAACLGGLIAFA
jgi:hypothetical protein